MTIVIIVSVLFQSGHSAEHAMCIVLYCINASFAMMVQKCAFSETFESYHHIALHCIAIQEAWQGVSCDAIAFEDG